MDSSWIILAGFSVVMGAILVYVALMIFLPEWVGITGKKALEAERGHTEEQAPQATSQTDAKFEKELENKPKA